MAATLLGSLLVSLGLESGEFKSGLSAAEKELRAAQRRIEKVGQNMANLGKNLSLAVSAPLVALGVASVKAAKESQDAIGQVNAALKSMGGQAGRTSEQLQGLATGLMKSSLFDDDEILRKVTANLLTFGNIAKEQFDGAQQAAVNLAARMGMDLQSATIMVGKALNDPVKGINALKRAGIQFTDAQKDQIKTMAEAGDVAGAQAIMLKELEHQFGGAAKAARDADPFAVLTQSWNEFQEKVGAQLIKALPAITDAITSVLDAFNSLSPGMQKAIVVAGVLAAAFGPLLIALGAIVSATAPFTAAIGALFASGGVLAAAQGTIAGLTAAFGPWAIAIAAVAAGGLLIYQNWDKIAPVLQNLWQVIQATIGPPLIALVEQLKAALSELWNSQFGSDLRTVIGVVNEFAAVTLKAIGPSMLAGFRVFAQVVGTTLEAVTVAVRLIASLFDGSFKNAISNSVRQVYEAVKTWLLDRLGAVWDSVKAKIDAVKGWFHDLYDAVVGHSYIPDMVDGIAEQMARLDAVMVDPAKRATAKTTEAFRKLAADVKPILDRLFPEIAAANAAARDFSALERARSAGILGAGDFAVANQRLSEETFANRPANDNPSAAVAGWDQMSLVDMQSLNAEFATFSSTLGNTLPSFSQFNGMFEGLGDGFEGLRTSIARSLTDVILGAESFGDALRNVFNRLASKILDNLFENLLGNLLGGIIPGFATGTSFAPGGLAVVGEKGPELVNLPRGSQVIPNGELRGMGGTTQIHRPTFVFPGVRNARDANEAAGQAARRYRRELNPLGHAV